MTQTNSIPASTIVQVNPNVLSAGGSALDIIGLVLTTSVRPPIGAAVPFADAADVANYFGEGSNEANIAAVYFAGYDGAQQTPESLLFAQYNQSPVSAYLRGGDVASMTLAQLQALTGSLTVVMDGYSHALTSQSLAAATSFSSAASILQTAFAGTNPVVSNFTAAIGATATGTGSGTNLTLSSVVGLVSLGDSVSGTGVPANTKIVSQSSGTPGGNGVYVTNNATTSSSASITVSSNVMNVSNVSSGTLQIGQVVGGSGVTVGSQITALGTGTGTTGTYSLSGAPQQVASESMTGTAPSITVTYDSVSGAFILGSSITGLVSTAAFATGTLAAPLELTSATGAVVSQGAPAATPMAFMTALTQVTQNWVTFMTAFDPDGGSGNAQKLLFAQWTSEQDDAYAYVAWDTDITPTETVPATSSLGYLLSQGDYSGTFLIYEPAGTNLYHAAFVCGIAASIDFSQTNGRITFKFRKQAGLTPGVTNATVAANLAANGYNFYGGYATRNQNFTFLANGVVSGPFDWMDAYIDQIWLDNELQTAILTGLTNVGSVPYNAAGNALIESFCLDPINAALAFGAIRTGVTLSAAQIAEVNEAAGANVAPTLQTRGWYLQVGTSSPQTRAARSSPPCTLWYTDGGAVQSIVLDSIEVQ